MDAPPTVRPKPEPSLFELEKVPTEAEVKKDLFNLETVPKDPGSK